MLYTITSVYEKRKPFQEFPTAFEILSSMLAENCEGRFDAWLRHQKTSPCQFSHPSNSDISSRKNLYPLTGLHSTRPNWVKGCSHITPAKIRDSWTPLPPPSAMVSIWLTHHPPLVSFRQHLPDAPFVLQFFT